MQTHGKYLFVGKLDLENAPLLHLSPTTEIEYPWRVCKKSLIIRYSKGWYGKDKGIVVGIWRKNKGDWYDSVLGALKGRDIEAEGNPRTVRENLEFL